MAIVRSLSMVGLVPVKVSQLVSLFMPYPAFSAMPTYRKSLAMVGLRSLEYIFPRISLTGRGKAPPFMNSIWSVYTRTHERSESKWSQCITMFANASRRTLYWLSSVVAKPSFLMWIGASTSVRKRRRIICTASQMFCCSGMR